MAAITGRLTINGSHYLEVAANPSDGTVAAVGSLATVSDGSGLYLKTGAGDTAWTVMASGSLSGSGATNKVAYWSGASTLTSDTDLHWDNTNNRLGVGTSPSYAVHVTSPPTSNIGIAYEPSSIAANDRLYYGAVAGGANQVYPFYFDTSSTGGAQGHIFNSTGAAILGLQTSEAASYVYTLYDQNSNYWTTGVDGGDSNKFKISASSYPGANDYFVVGSDGYFFLGTTASISDTISQVTIANTDNDIPTLNLTSNTAVTGNSSLWLTTGTTNPGSKFGFFLKNDGTDDELSIGRNNDGATDIEVFKIKRSNSKIVMGTSQDAGTGDIETDSTYNFRIGYSDTYAANTTLGVMQSTSSVNDPHSLLALQLDRDGTTFGNPGWGPRLDFRVSNDTVGRPGYRIASIDAVIPYSHSGQQWGRLNFYTADEAEPTLKMSINPDGYVGIGVEDATRKLLEISTPNTQGAGIALVNSSTSIVANDIVGSVDFYSDDLALSGDGQNRASIWAESTDAAATTLLKLEVNSSVSIDTKRGVSINENGYFGIGTIEDPQEHLHIQGRTGLASNILLEATTISQFAQVGDIKFTASSGTNSPANITGFYRDVSGNIDLRFSSGTGGTADSTLVVGPNKVFAGDVTYSTASTGTEMNVVKVDAPPILTIMRDDSSISAGNDLGGIKVGTDTDIGGLIAFGAQNDWSTGNLQSTFMYINLQDNTSTDTLLEYSLTLSKDKIATGTVTTTGDTYLHLHADGYVGLILDADTVNNSPTGEPSPFIEMLSDGGAVSYYLGGVSGGGDTAVGGVTSATQNALLVGTTSAYKTQLFTDSVVRMDIDANGRVTWPNAGGQVPVAWAMLSISSGSVTVSEDIYIGSVSTSGVDMTVNFSVTRANSNYVVLSGTDNNTNSIAQTMTSTEGTGSFLLHWYNFSGTIQNWSSYSGRIYITVFDMEP